MPNSIRNLLLNSKCEICHFDRYLELCHIIPKRIGGNDKPENKLILCPNHHKLLDWGLLNNEETAKIEHQLLTLADLYKDIQITEYLYFLLGYVEKVPKWMEHTRAMLKKKFSNGHF